MSGVGRSRSILGELIGLIGLIRIYPSSGDLSSAAAEHRCILRSLEAPCKVMMPCLAGAQLRCAPTDRDSKSTCSRRSSSCGCGLEAHWKGRLAMQGRFATSSSRRKTRRLTVAAWTAPRRWSGLLGAPPLRRLRGALRSAPPAQLPIGGLSTDGSSIDGGLPDIASTELPSTESRILTTKYY